MQSRSASFQVLCRNLDGECGVLRVHPDDGHWRCRSPFTWSCTMLISGGVAELWGAQAMPKVSEARAIARLLESEGITEAAFERDGVMKIRRGK